MIPTSVHSKILEAITNQWQEISTMSRSWHVSHIIPGKELGPCGETADSKSKIGDKQDDDKLCGVNKQRIYKKGDGAVS